MLATTSSSSTAAPAGLGRVLGAGLVAGFTNLVLGFGFAHVMGVERFQAMLAEHRLRPIGQPSDALPHMVVRLMLGVSVTALFACLTAGFGRGPRAALVAAVFGWAFVYAYTAFMHAHLGLYPATWAWSVAGWGLFEMAATATVGGWTVTGRRFWSS